MIKAETASVAITRDFDITRAIDSALGHIDLESIVRGRIVAVKPNDTWASRTYTVGVTQPDTLRAVLRYIRRFGPRQLVVTGGAGAAETDHVFEVSGMMKVVRDQGAEFFDHNRPPFTRIGLEYDESLDVTGPQMDVVVNPRVLEYETLISLAQLKAHDTATVTLALKNIAMSFPAADYYGHPRSTQKHDNFFFADMHSFIAAMAKRFPIDLAITVGHPAMVGSGPLGGHTVETGIVIASTDAVAADTAGARLLGFWPQGVRHLWEAGQLGLGVTAFGDMVFPAMDMEDAIKEFTAIVYNERLDFRHV